MRKVIPILSLMILAITMSLAQLANSAWPMFHHDLQHTGRSLYTGPATAALKWTFTTGAAIIFSSQALGADGTVYIGSLDGKLYAINPDGTQKWAFTAGGQIESSPALGADGTVYVGSGDNKLYAVNPDGTQRWAFTTGDLVSSSPTLGADGTVYVGSSDHKLYAINPDGTQRWAFTAGNKVKSSPALGADGTVYVGSMDKNLYAINPDGTQRWAFMTGGIIDSSPAIGADGTVYIGSYDNKLYAVNPDGTQRWAFTTGFWVRSSPALGADGTVYVGSNDKKLYAINSDGTQRWVFTTGAEVVSSPTLGADGTMHIGSGDGKLYAINPDGTQRWAFTTGNGIYSHPAIGADGTAYVGSSDGKLYAIGNGTQTLSITPPTTTINTGATQQFTATPAVGVTWTATGGTISNTGLFTAGNTAGTYTVTAKNTTDTATASVTITVAQTLTITPPTATINTGATQQFTATPATGVTWTATGGTISNTGLFTAGNTAGTYTVTAKNTTDTATASVTITVAPTLTITPPTATLNTGETQQFTATPSTGVTWTATGGTINNTGLFTAGNTSGTYDVTAKSAVGTATVSVIVIGVQTLTITPSTVTLAKGATQQFTTYPPSGVLWYARGGTISNTGLFTAGNTAGKYDVVAISAAGTATANITITAALTITPPTITLKTGATQQFTANPATGVTWTATGGTISNTGLFTAGNTAGTYTITAKNTTDTATANVTVAPKQTITVISPNGGEKWQQGSKQTITWSCKGYMYSGIARIELFKAGVSVSVIANPVQFHTTGTSTQDSHSYTVKSTQVPGTDYRIKIIDISDPTITSMSAADFEITGTPILTITPATATLNTGVTQQFTATPATGVTWTATGGTISNSGLYTAGNTAGTFTVVAKTALSTATATVTITAKPTLATPVLLSPTNRAINVAIPTTIAWQPVNNAVSYEYELFGAASATVPIETNTVTTTSATIQYSLAAKTIYTWRVRAIDANDLRSAFSIKWAFTTLAQAVIGTPVLILPQNNAIDVVINPTLTWRSAANATVYSIEIATDSTFTNDVVNVQDVTTTSYDVTNLTNKTKYYWRIKGGNGTIWGSPATASFTTIAKQGLPVPVLTSPTNGSTGAAIATTLTWQPVTNAVSYTVQYATNNNFSNATVLTGAVTTQNVTLLANTRYYWRVNATDIDGNASAWSSAWYFTTLTQAIQITAPTLITPADGDIDIPVKTTFTWSSVANVIAYDLEISKDATFTTRAAMGSTTTSLTATLANNIVYYWRVRGKNGNNLGIWSTTGTFTTVAFVPTAGVDAAIANSKVGNPLFGFGVVNNDGTLQTVNVDQPINRQSEFNIVVKNTGNLPDNFLITTASTINAKWKVTVYDIGGADISKKVFNGGWASYSVKPGESVILRLRFAAASGQTIDAANPPTQTIMLTAQSWKDITNGVATPASDTVVATAVLVKMSK